MDLLKVSLSKSSADSKLEFLEKYDSTFKILNSGTKKYETVSK